MNSLTIAIKMTEKLNIRDIIMGDSVFNGVNFQDWDMNLMIVLGSEKLLYTIERPIGPKPGPDQLLELDLWKTNSDDNSPTQSLMLTTMNP